MREANIMTRRRRDISGIESDCVRFSTMACHKTSVLSCVYPATLPSPSQYNITSAFAPWPIKIGTMYYLFHKHQTQSRTHARSHARPLLLRMLWVFLSVCARARTCACVVRAFLHPCVCLTVSGYKAMRSLVSN